MHNTTCSLQLCTLQDLKTKLYSVQPERMVYHNNINIQFLETHNTIQIVSVRVKSKY